MVARQALGMETGPVEELFTGIDWEGLALPDGTISHGYGLNGRRLRAGWGVFGGESWLVRGMITPHLLFSLALHSPSISWPPFLR